MTSRRYRMRLGAAGIETTALGFGCADLFREPSAARRARLMERAFDAGIRHFDTAPMYGLGQVESEIGRFARGKRDRLVIATKFGIEPAAVGRLIATVQAPVQRVLRRLPIVAGHARPGGVDPRSGPIGSLLYRRSDYSVQAARATLERSLRRLQTDHIDILFLHDPRPGDAVSDEIRGYLESARAAGEIRAWGVAGEPTQAERIAEQLGGMPILQVRGDIFSRAFACASQCAPQARILFGVISRALPRILFHLRSDERVRARWSSAIGADAARAEVIASLLLKDALAHADAPVLFSTTRSERIEAAALAAQESADSDPAVDAFRSLVRSELAGERARR